MPKTADFVREIEAQFARAVGLGKKGIEINAGELHRLVGGYPSGPEGHHAMPTCCQTMWKLFDSDRDVVIEAPPSKKGASLTLRYTLPRET